MNLPQRKHRSLAQGVVEQISGTIRQGTLKPGDKLPTESSLMSQHGVSRTVVREAISHLQAAGLVQTRHGIGTFVIERAQPNLGLEAENILTLRDVLSILELRIGIETETAGLAASRRSEDQVDELAAALAEMQQAMAEGRSAVEADKRFHLLIAQGTGNRYFVEMLERLGNAIIPRARLNTPVLEQSVRAEDKPADFLERVSREHDDIFRAIERRDPEAARAAMRTHLSNSRERLLQAQRRLESKLN
ncbi:FadR/GntR family transcriptional regulator [Massilia sp. YIM B02443]|uniref:FadR/GntR family transcriptional regulator n=1 Tax=Massilia sp. YIM B02443 TaxID=3050127 RepID=UPI0025B6B85E|nr:FadR/GntR family transcriptional regulator [Massilia sp. YIM B02443]MDN4039352.1 FadR/GntR family transcriptional regulator [Massilia sp. YIM B02443]